MGPFKSLSNDCFHPRLSNIWLTLVGTILLFNLLFPYLFGILSSNFLKSSSVNCFTFDGFVLEDCWFCFCIVAPSEVIICVPVGTVMFVDCLLPCEIDDNSTRAVVLSGLDIKFGKVVFLVFNKCINSLNELLMCSSIFAAGIGIYLGINLTVSDITSVLVSGM